MIPFSLPSFVLIRRSFLLALTFFCFLAPSRAADSEVANAHSFYQIGSFQEARDAYLNLLNQPDYANAPLLYYNLGNAHFRLGSVGQAILAYRRALHYANGDIPEARQNLRFLQDDLGYLTFASEPLAEFCAQFNPDTLRAIWILSCWTVGLILTVFIVLRLSILWKAPLAILGVLSLVLLVLTILAEQKSEEVHKARERLRLVVAEDVRAHTAPATTASEVFELPPGSEVRLIEERGSWCYVDILNDTRAWVLTKTLEPLIPPSPTKPSQEEKAMDRSVLN